MGKIYLGIAPTNFSHEGPRIIPDRMKNQAKYPEIPPNDLQEMGKGGEYALIPPINDTLGFGMDQVGCRMKKCTMKYNSVVGLVPRASKYVSSVVSSYRRFRTSPHRVQTIGVGKRPSRISGERSTARRRFYSRSVASLG